MKFFTLKKTTIQKAFNSLFPLPSSLSSAESGRSLVEVIGVMALGAIMIVGTFQVYKVIMSRMHRIEVSEDLRDVAKNSRLMFSGRGDYSNISVSYLIKSGAIKTDRPPRIAREYTVQSETGGKEFSINLYGVNKSDCVWAATQYFDWALRVTVNDYSESPAEHCADNSDNKVSIFVK